MRRGENGARISSSGTNGSLIGAGTFSSCLIGVGSLLIQCGEVLLRKGHRICAVISPEAASREWAEQSGLEHFDSQSDLAALLKGRSFDYLFSIAYLRVLTDEVIATPNRCSINFHDGPLPAYAGLNTPAWALMNRERFHGVTWHVATSTVDGGDILKERRIEISEGETALTLNARCYQAAIESFRELVDELATGRAVRKKQERHGRRYFSKKKRPPGGCVVRWDQDAETIAASVRALDFGSYPNPLGLPKVLFDEESFLVSSVRVLSSRSGAPPGTITGVERGTVRVATRTQEIALSNLRSIDGLESSSNELAARFGRAESARFGWLERDEATALQDLHESLSIHEDYWVERLLECEPLETPCSRSNRKQGNDAALGQAALTLSEELVARAEKCFPGTTIEDLLLAALGAFFARLGGTEHFDVAWSDPDVRSTVRGLERFVSTDPPLRFEVVPGQSFEDYLVAQKQRFELARRSKTFLLDLPARSPPLAARGPSPAGLRLPVAVVLGDRAERCNSAPGHELTVVIAERGRQVLWIHDARVVEASHVEAMQRHFPVFLEGIVSDRGCSIARLPLLAEEHVEQLRVWNDTVRDYPRRCCVHHMIEAQAARTPDEVAAISRGEHLTYRELNRRANRLARLLRRRGVGPEVLVGVCIERSLDMIVAILGVHKAGGAYVPLDPAYPQDRLDFILEHCGASLVLTSHATRSFSAPRAEILFVDGIDGEADAPPLSEDGDLEGGADSENLAYVLYTSGSTGKPKGVMVEHRNVVNFFVGMDETIGHACPSVWLAVSSLSFDISVLELLWTLARGLKIVLFTGDVSARGESSIAQLVRLHGVTHFQCTPSMASILIEDEETRAAFAQLRFFLIGGEACPAPLAAELRSVIRGEVRNMYGPTETTIWSTTHRIDGVEQNVPIGRPIANTGIHILDQHLQQVPIGVPGELMISGDGVARGYLHRPELTRQKFIRNPYGRVSPRRLYRTGDRARYLPDGNIEFLGRMDHQVKIRGYRIELGEIEALLNDHRGVRTSAVVAREDMPGRKVLVAYVIPSRGEALSTSGLRDYLAEKLPDYMVPHHVVALSEFAQTPNKKIDRNALPPPAKVRLDHAPRSDPPRTAIEKALAGVWSEALGVQVIGRQDSFFDLGGDSLVACGIALRIQQTCDVDLPLQTVFRAPTLAALASELEELFLKQASSVQPPTLPDRARQGPPATRGSTTMRC